MTVAAHLVLNIVRLRLVVMLSRGGGGGGGGVAPVVMVMVSVVVEVMEPIRGNECLSSPGCYACSTCSEETLCSRNGPSPSTQTSCVNINKHHRKLKAVVRMHV